MQLSPSPADSGVSRRKFMAMAAAVPAFMSQGVLAGDFWSQPRTLWLTRKTGKGVEEYSGTYFADGKLVWSEYVKICALMRDVQAGKVVQVSTTLLDILCGIQGVAAAYGHHTPLVTTSGYRSPATNNAIEGAAQKSMHLEARAWDGRMTGYPAKSIAEVAKYLQGGGVGLYVARHFVHVDDGRLRSWTGK